MHAVTHLSPARATTIPLQSAPALSRQAARNIGLRYVSDREPGISRKAVGRGFQYLDPTGARVRDAATLERIRSLMIPPAWTDVWICPRIDGHLQAVGRDARKRKQYRYHDSYRQIRDETKFTRMAALEQRFRIFAGKSERTWAAAECASRRSWRPSCSFSIQWRYGSVTKTMRGRMILLV
jgi:DNA topoisomerase IB